MQLDVKTLSTYRLTGQKWIWKLQSVIMSLDFIKLQ